MIETASSAGLLVQGLLVESEERYRALVNSLPNIVWVVEQTRGIAFISPSVETIVGYTAEEMSQRSPHFWLNDIHPDDCAAMKEASEKLARLRIELDTEFRFRHKDGKWIWLHTKTHTTQAKDKVWCIHGVTSDVTQRRQMEEEFRLKNEELKATLRQLKNSQTQLMQSSKMAAVGQLVAGVAHEINNPLMAISGYVQLLLADVEDAAVRIDLESIGRETDRIITIVSDLLAFSRKREPEKKSVSLGTVIESVIRLRAHELNVDNIQVTCDLDPGLPMLLGDSNQLQQVFLNLFNNAEQAMKEAHGKGTLIIRARKAGEIVRVTVTDDGPGIPPQNINKIFDPFFTTKAVGQGTGLGLSICYGIITEHGGTIHAESKPGEGATIVIELPVGH